MLAIEMSDMQLLEHTKQVEKDYYRIYGDKNNPSGQLLWEGLQYLKHLCRNRGLYYNE